MNWNRFGVEDTEQREMSSSRSDAHNTPSAAANFNLDASRQPCEWAGVDEAPVSKTYHVKLKFSDPNIPGKMVKLEKDGFSEFREKIAQRFKLDEKRVVIEYSLKNEQGGETQFVVEPCDGDEGIENFYLTTGNLMLITVFEEKKKSNRKIKKCEVKSNKIQKIGENIITDRYYETLDINIADSFLKKRKYIQHVLGYDYGANLLNPNKAICHVRFCMGLITLKKANNISSLVTHWETHTNASKASRYSPCCEVAVKRHKILSQKNSDVWRHPLHTPKELESLTDDAGDSLAIQTLTKKAFIAQEGKSFKGSSLMLEKKKVKRVITGTFKRTAVAPTATKNDEIESPRTAASSNIEVETIALESDNDGVDEVTTAENQAIEVDTEKTTCCGVAEQVEVSGVGTEVERGSDSEEPGSSGAGFVTPRKEKQSKTKRKEEESSSSSENTDGSSSSSSSGSSSSSSSSSSGTDSSSQDEELVTDKKVEKNASKNVSPNEKEEEAASKGKEKVNKSVNKKTAANVEASSKAIDKKIVKKKANKEVTSNKKKEEAAPEQKEKKTMKEVKSAGEEPPAKVKKSSKSG